LPSALITANQPPVTEKQAKKDRGKLKPPQPSVQLRLLEVRIESMLL